jgi:hypothetical protein
MDRLRSDMRYIKNIRGILSKIQENKANSHNWKSIMEVTESIKGEKKMFSQHVL